MQLKGRVSMWTEQQYWRQQEETPSKGEEEESDRENEEGEKEQD